MTTDGTTRRTPWFHPARLLHVAALLVVAGALGVLYVPLSSLPWAASRVEIDPAGMKPNGGQAYTVNLDLGVPSDSDGTSVVALFEDDLALTPHAPHQVIRDEGGGRFSHWGVNVYLSSSDQSDPRSNGRRYWAEIPAAPSVLLSQSRISWIGLVLGGLVALITGFTRAGAGWMRLSGLATLGVAGVLVTEPLSVEWTSRSMSSLGDAFATGTLPDAATSTPTGLAAATPRTLRLLADDVAFEAVGALPPPSPPAQVTLVPGPDVQQKDGLLRLETGQSLTCDERLPVSASHLAELIVRVKVHSGSALRFTFDTDPPLDSLSAAQLVVPVSPSPDWQTLRIARPLNRDQVARWLVEGDRPLTHIGLGPLGSGDPLVLELEPLILMDERGLYSHASHGTDWIETDDSFRPAHWQSAAGTFQIAWPAEARGRLRGSVAAIAGPDGQPLSYEVQLERVDGSRETLSEGSVRRPGGWTQLDIDLAGRLEPAPARLLLSAAQLPTGGTLAWSDWRVIDTSRAARRALFVLVDTLRGDALGSLGHPTNRTPRLDRLAAEGALFSRCYSQAFWTRPSMPSIMSGRYVHATGVHGAGLYLPDSYETLAESFASAGFQTIGFVGNAHAGPAAGLLQGLDEMILRTDIDDTQRFLDELVTPRLEQFLDEDVFAWIHLMEVHGPYGPVEAPADWQDPVDGTPVPWDERYDRRWNAHPTAESRRALYASDLESLDADLGAFLDAWVPRWEANGEAPVLAIGSDHGEFLGEYDTWGHEWNRLLPETVHVPLIVWAPGRLAGGTVWDRPVENIDIGATLLDLSGARPWKARDEEIDRGRSLVAVLDGRGRAADAAISAYDQGNENTGSFSLFLPANSFVGEGRRLIGSVGIDASSFRPFAQPERLGDLGADLGDPFGRLWTAYLQAERDLRQQYWGSQATSASQQIDAASIEQMQALGYLGR